MQRFQYARRSAAARLPEKRSEVLSTPPTPPIPPSWALEGAARIETDLTGTVVGWSDAAAELYGFSASEAIGRPIVDLVVPVRGREQAAEIMQSLALERFWEGEFDVRRSDGRLIRVLVHNAPSYDASGAVCGVVGHSVPAAATPPPPFSQPSTGAAGSWTRRLRGVLLDPSVGVRPRTRVSLAAGGVAFELLWSLVARGLGRGESVGLAGAVAILGVLAIAIVDVWAGQLVALVGGICFVVIVAYAVPPEPSLYAIPLIAVWLVSALVVGAGVRGLRRQAQRGVGEAVALHRELVGSLVPAPRLRRVDVSVATLYRPGEQRLELGGDFYAAAERDDSGLALLVGDVSGHGPEAAALAAMLRAGWEALVEAGLSPQARLRSLNHLLLAHARYEEFFATVCSVVINPDLSEATITLAGHPPPILMADGGEMDFNIRTGVPLGVSEDASWSPSRVALPPSFSLLLYTDGVIEGRASPNGGERFGEARLRDVVLASAARGRALLEEILSTASGAHGGPLPDDAALLLLEHRSAAS
jgi:PAS domain S-box-containing protein